MEGRRRTKDSTQASSELMWPTVPGSKHTVSPGSMDRCMHCAWRDREREATGGPILRGGNATGEMGRLDRWQLLEGGKEATPWKHKAEMTTDHSDIIPASLGPFRKLSMEQKGAGRGGNGRAGAGRRAMAIAITLGTFGLDRQTDRQTDRHGPHRVRKLTADFTCISAAARDMIRTRLNGRRWDWGTGVVPIPNTKYQCLGIQRQSSSRC